MGTVRVSAEGRVSPERFIEALTDFGAGRAQVWGNSSDSLLQVHGRGDTWAEVTEGSDVAGGIWQRYRYDWSTPGQVRLEVLDGNAWGVGSSWAYDVRAVDTGCHVDLVIVRKPTTTKGRLLEPLLLLGAAPYFRRDLRRTLHRLESTT
jgi:hypothetical protein